METSTQFFCHTCKKDFQKLMLNPHSEDEEVTCPHCNEYFVELIESQEQLKSLKELYQQQSIPTQNQHIEEQKSNNVQQKETRSQSQESQEYYECNDGEKKEGEDSQNKGQEEEKRSESQSQHSSANTSQPNNSNHSSQTFNTGNARATIRTSVRNMHVPLNGNQDWVNNIQNQINELMRSQGQSQVINQDGQNINVTTVSGNTGDATIHIANIENVVEDEQDLEELPADDGNNDWEDVDEENPIDAEIQQVEINIDLDEIIDQDGGDLINQLAGNLGQQQQQTSSQQQQPSQEGQQQQPQPQPSSPNQPNTQQQQQQQAPQFNLQNILGNFLGGAGQPQFNENQQVFTFNLTGPNGGNILGNLGNLFQGFGSNLENNILNQVIQESLNTANPNQGIPTSKAFIEKMSLINGSDLMVKKDCQVCQETFKEEDKMYKLPCKHLFHKDCILPWLEKHNTCPTCRHELPTDDIEYENRRRQGDNVLRQFINGGGNNQNNNGNNANNNGNSNNTSSFNSTYHS